MEPGRSGDAEDEEASSLSCERPTHALSRCALLFPQVPDVSVAYWDQTSEGSRTHGLPRTLTDETVELDGEVKWQFDEGRGA